MRKPARAADPRRHGRSAATPPITTAPQRSETVSRPNPAQDRIGSASALDTAQPKIGEIAAASGRSAMQPARQGQTQRHAQHQLRERAEKDVPK